MGPGFILSGPRPTDDFSHRVDTPSAERAAVALRWQGNCRPKGRRERVAKRYSQRPCGHPGVNRRPSLPGLRCPAL